MTHLAMGHRALESLLGNDPTLGEIAGRLGSHQCWVVGGWVRDRALGLRPPDLDLVVRGVEAAKQAAIALGTTWKSTPRLLGKPDKAVWRLAGPKFKVEIWPLEIDDLEADALRRDFTCNALFWRLPDGPLLDFSDGLDDINHRRLRAVSKENLVADPVRLLRGVRLMATLEGFTLESRTHAWVADLAPGLANAPRERVGAELLALARAPRASLGLRASETLGLFKSAGPEIHRSVFNASVDTLAFLVGEKPHPAPGAVAHDRTQALLAWLASGWLPVSANQLKTFAWPKELAANVAVAASMHEEAVSVAGRAPANRREFIARCGSAFPQVLALAAALDQTEGHAPQKWKRFWSQWTRSKNSILEPVPLLSTSEVAAATSTEPGPQLGRILAELKRATVRREVRTEAGARRWLRRYSAGTDSAGASSADSWSS